MKPRPSRDPAIEQAALHDLANALAHLKETNEIIAFLHDLCTPAELEALTDRWRVVPLLQQGMSYREINEHTNVSVTTIGRVARSLERGEGGYTTALQHLKKSSS